MKEKESLAKREQDLHEQEKVTRGELDAASKLLVDMQNLMYWLLSQLIR